MTTLPPKAVRRKCALMLLQNVQSTLLVAEHLRLVSNNEKIHFSMMRKSLG